jgi:Vault protein inter-alpha-trypsin domain/von Willebrand factor type A domain
MPETSTIPSAGLFARDDSHALIPLSGVSIHAEISGLCARVVVAHRYVNRETTPIEAVYVFPLDEGAAVCGFEAVIDGTLVIGEVQEREQAFETYDAAMEHGHGAFLLDEERPDVFQASVGNLPPGKEVLVRLTYVVELSIDGGRLRFTIPTTVSPRYAPKEDQTGTGRPDSETLNPPVAWTVPYGLSLSVHLSMPGRTTALESPSHPIAVALNEAEATVTFAQGDRALDRDFVLSIDAAGLDAPQAWIERDDEGQEAVAVAFVPAFANTSCPADIVFVVDRSGSMQGTSIEEVRNALQLCLRSMIPGCRFNIIGFGSTHHALFPESRAYDQASLEAASSHVAGLQADLGGTEILDALDFALRQPRHPELVRQLVVLTDGEVTNTDAVLALATRHAADVRIFTFGIGAGASYHLVRGLARIGGGSAEFIYPGERIEPKVIRQFARLLSPALGDAAVDWMGGDVTQAPTKVPPVFAGNRLLVYGLVKATPTAVRLTATGPSGSISLEVPLDTAPHVRGKTVATLAARARIRELEEGSEWLGTRGSRQKDRKQQSVTKEIVELSIRYGLISRETSYVAVERRETPVHDDIQLRRVPIALTSGWGGLERWLPVLHASRHAKMAGWFDLHRVFSRTDAPQGAPMLAHQALEAPLGKLDFHVDHLRVPRLPMRPSGMDALIALQAADGSWDLTAELARIIGRRLSELEAAVDGASGASPSMRRAWATALALAWLQLHAGGLQEEWRLLAAKARNWIEDAGAVAPGGSHWIDAATRFLSP